MKNTKFLEHPVNKYFEEILWMSSNEFRDWCIELRKVVVDLWDNEGLPPRVGFTEAEMAEQFQNMLNTNVQGFLVKDEMTGKQDVIRNTLVLGNAVNDFFPTMMKTRINYSKDVNSGLSIYDHFAKDTLLDKFVKYASRHFKRDSFYHYSVPARSEDKEHYGELPFAETGKDWIVEFEKNYRSKGKYDYWLSPKDSDKTYSGYNDELRKTKFLDITRASVDDLGSMIPEKCKVNANHAKKGKPAADLFQIRVFELHKTKLFPLGLKAFRVSFCQYAVNFPPMTAKFMYERYCHPERRNVVWDPSAGWGGRLLGALAADRQITYIGNDPNTDHNLPDGTTKYDQIYNFFTNNVQQGGLFPVENPTIFIFSQQGSETMQSNPVFKKYKGKVDFIFTSPPYFAKEAYSEDEDQSYKKFSQYDLWRDGFLHETLKTAVSWLKPGGIIAWNIADAVFGGDMLPLEADSCQYLEKLGMKHVETLKMALAQMPGGNRVDEETGLPKAKNFSKVNGIWLKYEPIFVYQKPGKI